MSYHVVKMDNPKDPVDAGVPTRLSIVGPFPTLLRAEQWGRDPIDNPNDNPCWQVISVPPGKHLTFRVMKPEEWVPASASEKTIADALR